MDVSIIITTFNYSNYLEECIESCLRQKTDNIKYEVIVVDDGSTDDTPTVMRKFLLSNVRYYRIDNSGIERASNFGFSKAKGKYIVRVDADDILLSGYMLTMQPHIAVGHSFIYSDYMVIDQNSIQLREFRLPEFDRNEIFNRGDFLATGTLFRADLLERLSGYKVNIINSGLENYELILRLLESGYFGVHIPQILFGYRRHSQNISELKKNQIVRNGKLLFKTNKYGVYSSNQFHPYGLEVS
jgi:glycosyltransferase involved in cell wall biosynthesis